MRVGELREWLSRWPDDNVIDFTDAGFTLFPPDVPMGTQRALTVGIWEWDETKEDFYPRVTWHHDPAAADPPAPPGAPGG